MKKFIANNRGNMLAFTFIMMMFMLLVVMSLVKWSQQEVKTTSKKQKSTVAHNMATAAVERGMWKLKSSTTTWATAAVGTPITGYRFDTTYRDVTGGTYRIRFSSGPSTEEVTIYGEGRDSKTQETRAIKAVFENQSFPGPVLAGGSIAYSGALEAHWGPVLAQNNITLSGAAADNYFPRKLSRQAVVGTASDPRDTNGLTPPNTDNQEWWSDYDVPEVPQLDFTAMRASATANGTLNYFNGFASSHTYTGYSGSGHVCKVAGTSTDHPNPHSTHFACSTHHPRAGSNFIWYWDNNVIFTGGANLSGHGMGLYGTVIVRGNLTIETEDNLAYTASIPSRAWREYQRIDTSASNEYPGDTGLRSNAATFGIGSSNWSSGPASGAYTDVGFRGLVYVGGNLTIASNALGDFAGVLWVVGNVVNNNTGEKSYVFYDRTVQVPVLNVVLERNSWQEVSASTITWP